MPQKQQFSHFAAWGLIPLLTLFSQSFMKLLAHQTVGIEFGLEWLKLALHSPWTLAILATEIMSFFLWMRVLSHLDVSRAVPLTSIAYVLILATSYGIFGETLSVPQLLGASLILFGVWLIGTTPTVPH